MLGLEDVSIPSQAGGHVTVAGQQGHWATTCPPEPATIRREEVAGPTRHSQDSSNMREIVHIQAGQCGNQIGAKVGWDWIRGWCQGLFWIQ